jgi:outer membrane autotransporter protein
MAFKPSPAKDGVDGSPARIELAQIGVAVIPPPTPPPRKVASASTPTAVAAELASESNALIGESNISIRAGAAASESRKAGFWGRIFSCCS